MNLDVHLSPELKRFVDDTIKAGHFASASELISAALHYLKGGDSRFPSDPERLAELQRQVAVGVQQADAGKFVEFDAESIKTEGRAKQAAARRPS